jgi:hypothetical protein
MMVERADRWLQQKQQDFELEPEQPESPLNEIDHELISVLFKSSRQIVSVWRMEGELGFDKELRDLLGP